MIGAKHDYVTGRVIVHSGRLKRVGCIDRVMNPAKTRNSDCRSVVGNKEEEGCEGVGTIVGRSSAYL